MIAFIIEPDIDCCAPVRCENIPVSISRLIVSHVIDKVKKKVTKAKDKVLGTANKATGTTKEKISSSSSSSKTAATKGSSQGGSRRYEEGAAGTTSARTKDPTREYDEKEPMSPAKI